MVDKLPPQSVIMQIVKRGELRMFHLFKKKDNGVHITAPIEGTCVALSEVPDEVFSQKMMGDGIAIQPTGDTLCAPISGVITAIIDSHHAFGITSDDGIEILVHCGLDTVNLGGKGFTVLKEVNTRVQAGDPIIKVDTAFMKEQNIPLITPVILLNTQEKAITNYHIGEVVKVKESVILDLI